MSQYAYFDTNSGAIINWIDTAAFSYPFMPADTNLFTVTPAQWETRDQYQYVVNGALSATPAPLTAAQISSAEKLVANATLKQQIVTLENGQSRAVREAALGIAGAVARLQVLDAQIISLRGKLK